MSFIRNFSIRNKLIALILLAGLPSIILGYSYIIISDVVSMRKNMLRKSYLEADLVGRYCIAPLAFGYEENLKKVLDKLRETLPHVEEVYVFNDNGRLFGSYSRDTITREPPPAPNGEFEKLEGDSILVAKELILDKNHCGYIYTISSAAELPELTTNRIISLLLAMIGAIALAYVLALRFQRVISEPILTLAKVTEKISDKPDYSVRVEKHGKDEIGTLYDGFNNMLQQIQLWEKKRDRAQAEQVRLINKIEEKNKELEQVIYVTSHDLRSPLVNIQGFEQELNYALNELLNILSNIELPEETRTEITRIVNDDILDSQKYIRSSSIKMEKLLSGLLKLSRVDRMGSTYDTIDMNRLMEEIINGFEFRVKEAGVTTQIEKLPPCFGNELQINQLFSNLISNALKYCDPARKGIIKISGQVDSGKNRVVYCVSDNGIGIPIEHQKRIFDIFHRLNPEEGEGEGLGLSIVQKIVNRHNGHIWVKSGKGEGSRFFIELPSLEEPGDFLGEDR